MFDFRLKVFNTVARRLNFTKASLELNISQPAVTKHIKEIEHALHLQLFERNGTKIKLTKAGEVLKKHTQKIIEIHQEIEFEMSEFQNKHKGNLRLGASTTIAQYVLPPLLAEFHQRFPEIKNSLVIQNTEQIETMLIEHSIDLGLIEGFSKNRNFHYKPFMKDEIVLVGKAQHPILKKKQIKIEELQCLSFVEREPGSGTLETIETTLKNHHISMFNLKTEMQLGNTESIKSYLQHSEAVAFLSVQSIVQELRNNQLAIIDIKNIEIPREFNFITAEGEQSKLIQLFIQFALNHNQLL